jgi:hypothetical protein
MDAVVGNCIADWVQRASGDRFLVSKRRGLVLQGAFKSLGAGPDDARGSKRIAEVGADLRTPGSFDLNGVGLRNPLKTRTHKRLRRILRRELDRSALAKWASVTDGRWLLTDAGVKVYTDVGDPAELWRELRSQTEGGVNWVRPFDKGSQVAISLGAFALLGVAAAILAVGIPHIADLLKNHGTFQDVTTYVVNQVLLVFIIVELVETAEHQIRVGLRESLQQGELVPKLLIIGILASIRHLLSVGADLTRASEQNVGSLASRLHEGSAQVAAVQKQAVTQALQGIAVNAVVVLVLVAGLILFARYFNPFRYRSRDAPRRS